MDQTTAEAIDKTLSRINIILFNIDNAPIVLPGSIWLRRIV